MKICFLAPVGISSPSQLLTIYCEAIVRVLVKDHFRLMSINTITYSQVDIKKELITHVEIDWVRYQYIVIKIFCIYVCKKTKSCRSHCLKNSLVRSCNTQSYIQIPDLSFSGVLLPCLGWCSEIFSPSSRKSPV